MHLYTDSFFRAVRTSVIPVGTQTSNQTDASQEDWNEEDKNKGGLGVGGGEFEGNDW